MRPVATREVVFDAAETLTRRGEEPSSRAVRDEIGGGSLATIQRHLRAWKVESREDAPREDLAEDSAIAERLDDLARALIGLRLDFAEGRKDDDLGDETAAALASLAAAITGLRVDLAERGLAGGADFSASIDALRRDLRTMSATIQPLTEEVRRLSEERDRLIRELARVKDRG